MGGNTMAKKGRRSDGISSNTPFPPHKNPTVIKLFEKDGRGL
jgi:hypothetical protein